MIRIGVTIMHHPRRADRLPALLRACAPLEPTVVTDPEPDGPPSPLRTAKRAWAAIDPQSTHHLVLQDDVRPVPGFADRLQQAIASRPRHGVSLFSLWDTPHNSYLVRRAVVAGARFAPLSPFEWTPTQGFALPTDTARELAAYLSAIPDKVQDDDEMIVIFCRERSIPVVSAVPHLMEHGQDPSLVDGHHNGLRATLCCPETAWPSDDQPAGPELPPGHYAVELRNSVCSLRSIHGEPVEHQFPWYWYDACHLADVDAEDVLRAAAPRLSMFTDSRHGWAHDDSRYDDGRGPRNGRRVEVLTEAWAAGYLLGADVALAAPDLVGRGSLTVPMLETWIRQGLLDDDLALPGLAADCVRLASSAVGQALFDRKASRCVPR